MNRRSEGLISILNPNGEPNTGLALSSKQKAIIAALQYPGHPLQELAEDVAWFNQGLDTDVGHIEARGGQAPALRRLHEKGIKTFIGVYPDRPGEVYFVVRTDIPFEAFPEGVEGAANGKLRMDYRVKLTSASRWDGWFKSSFAAESAEGKWGGQNGEYRDSLRIEPELWFQQLRRFESPLGRAFLVEDKVEGNPDGNTAGRGHKELCLRNASQNAAPRRA